MKIVFFDGNLREGGAERVISILANKFADQGDDVEIILYYDDDIFYKLNPQIKISIIESQTGTKRKLKNIAWLCKYISKDTDVLISFLAMFNIIAIIASKIARIPVIVADRNDPRKVPSNWGMRLIRNCTYCFADRVVLQTEYNKKYFPLAVQKKSAVIYNPINIGNKSGLAMQNKKQKKIVSVGRLIPQKNHRILLKAFLEIHKKYPDYYLVIYGEGPERKYIEEVIVDNQLESSVYLPGIVENVLDNICDAEMFVLCSDYEGMPNVLIEAMGIGLPVISTKVSGATELISHKENGLLVDVGDVTGLYKAMELYLLDKDVRDRCSRNAVKINKRLAADSIVDIWKQCIKKI